MGTNWTRRGFLGTLGAGIAAGEFSRLQAQAQAQGQTPPPNPARDAANVDRDVVFGKGGNVDLKADIYRPTGTSKRMAVIHYHGGGFTGGNKTINAARCQAMSALGYTNISAQYRLGGEARWPAQIEDVKAAIRWTRANAAKLGIDPNRIAIAGYSAGGHLAAFAGGTQNNARYEGTGGNPGVPTTVQAVIPCYPATGQASWEGFRKQFPLPADSSEADWKEVELASHAGTMPPTLLHHGLADVTVRPEHSQEFLKVLRAANIPSELHEWAGVPHEFIGIPEFATAVSSLNDFFLERHVINPRTYPPFGPGGGGRGGRGGEAGRGAGEGRGGRGQ